MSADPCILPTIIIVHRELRETSRTVSTCFVSHKHTIMTKRRQSGVDIVTNEDMIRDLVKKRSVVKGKLTLFTKYVDSLNTLQLTEQIKVELKERFDRSKVLFDQFSTIQDELDLIVSESQVEKELTERETFENNFYALVTKCKCMLKDSDSSQSASNNQRSTVKLPTISLPSFDGTYDQWLEFRDTYLSVIHNCKDLDNIQKFHYLRSVLKGNALQVIKSLEFSSNNYITAWDLLENRYNNKRLLVHNHCKALFTAPSVAKESASHIRRLIDTILRNIRALKTLGEPTDAWDTLIVYVIVTKLDSSTEREWELHKSSIIHSNETLTLSDLLKFLKDRADVLETIQASQSKYVDYGNRKPSSSAVNHSKFTHSNVSTQKNLSKSSNSSNSSKRYTCILCQANHPLYACEAFLKLSIGDRYKYVNNKNLCSNCLRGGHAIKDCWFGSCKQCNKKHNTLLHKESNDTGASSLSLPAGAQVSLTKSPCEGSLDSYTHILHTASHKAINSPSKNNSTDCGSHNLSQHVLLSTALVEIADRNNEYHTFRALLDNGSQHCFISDSLSKKLNVPTIQSTVRITGVGNCVTQCTKSCEIHLRSKTSSYNTRFSCFVLDCVTARLPTLENNRNIQIPENIQLADPNFYLSNEIHLLIGADIFWGLLNKGLIRLPSGPYLQNTKLGWVISGLVYTNSRIKQVHCNFSLESNLRRFWELEEINSNNKDKLLTKSESLCENLFKASTTRDNTGRFCVRIPLSESADVLGDSLTAAENRFRALERKLDRCTDEYKQMYKEFMTEYSRLGHMTRVSDYNSPHYFLPHHGVFRVDSTTTKLRVVFDASATTTSGKSFNDIQLIGPALQNDLVSILLRFRQFKYVVCADVEKMYRQILVHPEQRDLQLILWRDNPCDPIGVYRLNTVTYGTASAPFLSIRCLKQLASEVRNNAVAQVINEDMYVDDVISGNDDKELLIKICDEVSKVLKSGGFHLRKWVFNTETSKFPSKDLSLGNNCHTKTLGLGWLHDSDELFFTSKCDLNDKCISKRAILSVISQIFDPLGLLGPTTIIAKLLLQKLWLSKIGWDDSVPNNILNEFQTFIHKLNYLQNLRVPRHIKGNNNTQRIELHIFSDASQGAYGACAYVRTVSQNSEITVHLLCAKGKVAPVKPVSIPRLELCAALVGAKLYDKIVKSLRLTFDNVQFWSDSTIVLGWLRMPPSMLKTFVQNRVVEINDLTGELSWTHVAGKQNPADLLSRGMHLDVLSSSHLWWSGPSFLHEPNVNCKHKTDSSTLCCDELPELNQTRVSMTILSPSDIFPFNRFSSYNRLVRATAYILRFINNCRNKKLKRFGPLILDELDDSTKTLTRISQRQSFSTVYDDLKNKRNVNFPRNISSLNIFLDEHDLIRIGGRLSNSESFTYGKMHPLLLCNKHSFTKLLFRHHHQALLHAGPQLLLATIRDSWWPLRGRDLARLTVRTCVRCVRLSAKPYQVQMGNLPTERIEQGFPFIRCGVDYAGPLFYLNRKGKGAKLEKCYICLFVCFSTRAIHLELVTSLTSQAYILALKRFLSRRGKPSEIFSDNGRTFVGAAKELQIFLNNNESDIIDFATNNSIKFTFIPPYSPHFGGLWEAGVKSCKFHLRRVVGNANLTYEELSTTLAQIEAVLNSRPISPLSTDPNDLLPLTPAHFLIGRPLTAPACRDLTEMTTQRLVRYDRVEQMRQHFWARWAKEYISELQKRTKWQTYKDTIIPNTLVLIKDDNLPPLKWRLGRVLRAHAGKDGITRVASIKTETGEILRAFSRICPLLPAA